MGAVFGLASVLAWACQAGGRFSCECEKLAVGRLDCLQAFVFWIGRFDFWCSPTSSYSWHGFCAGARGEGTVRCILINTTCRVCSPFSLIRFVRRAASELPGG